MKDKCHYCKKDPCVELRTPTYKALLCQDHFREWANQDFDGKIRVTMQTKLEGVIN